MKQQRDTFFLPTYRTKNTDTKKAFPRQKTKLKINAQVRKCFDADNLQTTDKHKIVLTKCYLWCLLLPIYAFVPAAYAHSG